MTYSSHILFGILVITYIEGDRSMINDKKYLFGKIDTIAGNGEAGYSGDGEDASRARLNGPAGLAIDKEDNVYIAELQNHAIRKIDKKLTLS